MDTQRFILVTLAVVQLALWLALAGRYRTPVPAQGTIVLRYGWKLRMLGLCIAFAIPMLMILVFVLTPIRHTPLMLPVGITLLALGCVGGILLVETQGVHFIVSDTTLVAVSAWRGRREWRWDEIEKVSFARINRWLILGGPRQESVRASLYLANIGELARALVQHVSGMKLAAARNVIHRLASGAA